jgi:Na+-transporting NADH:ubiquinone oxidoreductase subunit NqrA
MGRITGRVEVIVNGTPLLNKEGATAEGIGISGEPNFELEPVGGDTGLHGFKETYVPARLEVTVTDRDDVSLSDLARIKGNGTVIFRAAGGGKVYTLNGATCMRNFTVTAGEGETTVVFVGPYWTEATG